MPKRSNIGPETVSCESCRSKKLKCDRVEPCSNCVARAISCHFVNTPAKRQKEIGHAAGSNADIILRIERLEQFIPAKEPTKRINVAGYHEILVEPEAEHAAVVREATARDEELDALETIESASIVASCSIGLTFEVRTTREILTSYDELWNVCDVLILPPFRTAMLLLESFEANVEHVCYVLNNALVRSMIKRIYLCLSQRQPALNEAALLLALASLAAFFYQPSEISEVAITENECLQLSRIWGQSALRALGRSQQMTVGTLEDVQAHILMSYVAFHVESFSTLRHYHVAMATSLARSLRLHRLDSDLPLSHTKIAGLSELIDREVKRRVFWHITATDWLESTMSGPQEGTYSIHPNHIRVELPGEEAHFLVDIRTPTDEEAQPTAMTFLLARVRLARLCREVTDLVPLETCKLVSMPYKHIVDLDAKFKSYLDDLPFFLRSDANSRARSRALEVFYPGTSIMRYSILTAAHSRRCRLHQRFLLRQTSDHHYAYSRQACLESARIVIDAFAEPQEGDAPSLARARMEMAIHHTHLAVVILVMDLCFNKVDAEREGVEADVAAALQVLYNATTVSQHAMRSVKALETMLQNHEVAVPAVPAHHRSVSHKPRPLQPNTSKIPDKAEKRCEKLSPGFDTLQDSFWDGGMDIGTLDWDSLFASLDSRPF